MVTKWMRLLRFKRNLPVECPGLIINCGIKVHSADVPEIRIILDTYSNIHCALCIDDLILP